MSGLPWFKCYPRDFNRGVAHLTMEERGAYITIINEIYERGCPVEDNALFWRSHLLCSGKAWSKVRAALIVKGRLYAVDYNGRPCLMDERAAEEIQKNQELRRELSERGSRGGRKSQAALKENNDLTQATAQAEVKQGLKPGSSDTEAESEADNTTVTIVPVVVREPKPKASKRCPADWSPSPADIQIAADLGFSPGEIERELATIRDCTFGVARSDWSATCRNWFRREAKSRKPQNGKPDKLTARHDNYAASWTGSEQAAGVLAARRAF